MNLLLLSNSSSEAGYLVHAKPAIAELCAGLPAGATAAFLPYAGITRDWDTYTAMVTDALADLPIAIEGVHRSDDPVALIQTSRLIIVGGGNTFNLLRETRNAGLLPIITQRVRAGEAAYLGWSAGSNLACPTIRTTNDMPIADPGGLDALSLVPFQINTHFTDAHPPGHRGETRRQRLAEFCTLNPTVPVLCLPEGSGLRVEGRCHALTGPHDALWMHGTTNPSNLPPGSLDLPL